MHVAIIMNGNGRWAARRGLPPTAGHPEGAAALRTTVELALRAGVKTLTLYALRAATCATSAQELEADLRVLWGYLRSEAARPAGKSVRISIIGKCDRLHVAASGCTPKDSTTEGATCGDSRLHLRIVIDYSAHDSLVRSSWHNSQPQAAESFAQHIREIDHTALPAGAVDLLIRTGGGQCHSDFMLWEVAYARLHYAECLWPDFGANDFERALSSYTGHDGGTARLASVSS
jgi:undecaprenyl diphosphate synthase